MLIWPWPHCKVHNREDAYMPGLQLQSHIVPCPYCAGWNATAHQPPHARPNWAMHCDACKAFGPVAITPDAAGKMWNLRASVDSQIKGDPR